MTYGHHIMRALGNKICYHSPSRGFAMDVGSMFTVLLLSKLGVPGLLLFDKNSTVTLLLFQVLTCSIAFNPCFQEEGLFKAKSDE
jgi:hypothetical protein